MTGREVSVRRAAEDDRPWIGEVVRRRWGADVVVSRGVLHRPALLPAFVAELDGVRSGILTYRRGAGECEIVTLDSLAERLGVGSALIAAAQTEAEMSGCNRLWLVTTNDNLNAIRFYQKRGFRLCALHRNALEVSRRLKPEIPLLGNEGIPITDEIELELALNRSDGSREA
jgi:GNAT superfamily N-acetyltransferase